MTAGSKLDDRSQLVVGEPVELFPGIRRLLAPNASAMTGPGTNTYLVGHEDLVVIDPGPDDPTHIERIVESAIGNIRYIVVTHSHRDHAPGAALLARITGATLLGFDARPNFKPDGRILEGDTIVSSGWKLEAIHTPGHSSDHLCFIADSDEDKASRLLFSGDHIMEGSTVVIGPPDGDMADYLASLERLHLVNPPIEVIAPGHGMLIADPRGAVDAYIALRRHREESIFQAVEARAQRVAELVPRIYEQLPDHLVRHARRSVWAHLRKLHEEERVYSVDPDDPDSLWSVR